MTSIVETIQKIVRNELQTTHVAELGVVEAVSSHKDAGDNDNYGCDVRLKNTGLLLKRIPVATNHVGSVAIPNVGDLVLFGFVNGDVNQAIVIGRLYTDDDRSPLNTTNEMIMRLPLHADDPKLIKTAVRNIPANKPPREIIAAMPPKITVHITDGTIKATAGKSEMTLDQPDSGTGTVTVLAGGTKITMNQDGDVTVESIGDMTLQSGGAMTLKAATNLKITAGTNVEIDAGAGFSVDASAQASITASASLSLKAATISLAGMTSFGPG